MMARTLTLWTVYERPTDYPEGFIGRRWEIGEGAVVHTPEDIRGPDIDTVRRGVIAWFNLRGCGAVRIDRDPSDEPQIVEVWL